MSDTPRTDFNEFEAFTDQGIKVKVVLAEVARQWERGEIVDTLRARIAALEHERDQWRSAHNGLKAQLEKRL